jgi:glutathione S-transferase
MYVLHYCPDTASTIIRLVLEELGVPHECRLIDRENGELNSEAYRALSPLGLIPALETPDGAMFETAAILLYLADTHKDLAPSPDSPERAVFLSWLFFTSSNIHQTLLQFFYPDRVAGPKASANLILQARSRMKTCLQAMETMVARDEPDWMSPERPSILAFYVGVLVHWLSSYEADHPSHFKAQEYPALHRVLEALEARPSVRKVAMAEDLNMTMFTAPY